MKFLHTSARWLLIASFFAAAANAAIAQAPMMIAASGASDSAPSVRIVEPADGATIHDNSGNMTVRVAVEPPLAANGEIELLLDGRPAAARRDGDAFILSGIDRGTHILQARGVGKDGSALAQSAPVTFYLWQASALFRQPK